ncbi:MAG: DUF309 domain-containing protein [Acidobacteria bacterium]|nr:DUF309 domain-containing protein [Acidobacteriota bacterium]
MNSRRLEPAFREFIELFDSARFWEAHEVLESAWKEERQDFYKGLIQIAAAWLHLERGNRAGVLKVLPRALGYLEKYPSSYQGWDLAELIAVCRRCLKQVRSGNRSRPVHLELCPLHMSDFFQGTSD